MKKWLCGLVLFLTLVVPHYRVTAGNVTLDNNIFNNVVVALSSTVVNGDMDNPAIQNFVNIIENILRETSKTLFRATGNRFTFGSVIVLGPANADNWDPLTSKSRGVRSTPTFSPPTFDTADIRIDDPNSAYGSRPYTQQSRLCGERGDFIHLTSDFLKGNYDSTKLGTQDELLAREWVKYYFGVFDEQGYDYNNMYPVKYFAPGGALITNICNTTQIRWNDDSCSGTSSVQGVPSTCNLDAETNQNVTSSMMSLPLAPVAAEFCFNSTNHNADAPNKHNIMCNGKSVMEVVQQNSQVQSSNSDNAPDSISFSFQQFTSAANPIALAVLWDNFATYVTHTYSSYAAFAKFISYDLPIGGKFAFQQTCLPSGSSSSNSDVTYIDWCSISSTDSSGSRKTCLSHITSVPTGDNGRGNRYLPSSVTNILTKSSTSVTNNIKALLFVTDNSLSDADTSNMCTQAKNNNFQLFVVSYNSASVKSFQTVSECVGFARAVYIKGPKSPLNSTMWDDDVTACYGFLQERKLVDEFLSALPNAAAPMLYGPPQTYYEQLLLNSTVVSMPITEFSSTITNMTNRFYFESCDNLQKTNVRSFVNCKVTNVDGTCSQGAPDTYIYCGDSLPYTSDSRMEFVCNCTSASINGMVQQPPYLAYVVGQPLNAIVDPSINTPQITLKAWNVVTNNVALDTGSAKYTTVRLFASLMRGNTPIFNANVSAIITFATSTNNSVTIKLRDDGSGNPDVSEKDGIYSAYFTQFGTPSTYTVSVNANDNGWLATYPTSAYPWISKSSSMHEQSTESFSRTASAGSFSVDSSASNGNLPPGRILDLQVESSTSDAVVLKWTAPGKDLDYGTASNYHIKCSTNKADLDSNNFDSTSDPSGTAPGKSGSKQTYTVSGSPDDATHYCAVFACDDRSACSPASNLVPYSIVQTGLTGGQIAGISIGVILIIVIIVVISVIIFFKCFRKKDKTPSTGNLHASQTLTGEDKLKPIPIEALPNTAIYQPGYGVDNEGAQKHSRPTSSHSVNDSFDSITSKNTQNLGQNQMLSFQHNSRTPSPKPVAIPKVPAPFNAHPIEVIQMDAPPSREQIINARPLQNAYERDRPTSNDSSVFFVNNPDVARPILLTQMATIEDTGDYQDVNYKPEIPVYHHLLNKPNMYTNPGVPPPAPPKKNNYGNTSLESHSSDSSSSSSAHTNRTPRHNTQV